MIADIELIYRMVEDTKENNVRAEYVGELIRCRECYRAIPKYYASGTDDVIYYCPAYKVAKAGNGYCDIGLRTDEE